MKKSEITCDQCERDILTTGMQGSYYVRITSEQRPYRGGAVAAIIHYPAFKQDHHFCNFDCLAAFVLARQVANRQRQAEQERQIAARLEVIK